MSIPANATEVPTIAKVWRQAKDNIPTFAAVWGLIFMTTLMDLILYLLLLHMTENSFGYSELAAEVISHAGSLPTTILKSLAAVLMTAVPVLYYTTDRCPGPGEILGILVRRPWRYLMGGLLFAVLTVMGLLLCVVPGILVVIAMPIYTHYVFTTDLNLVTCLSKSFKAMFRDHGAFLGISFLWGLATIASLLLCILPALVVWPMAELYLQNYIHHKGLVSTPEPA